MKAIYAGGKSFHIQSDPRQTDDTAPADVVFACFPGGIVLASLVSLSIWVWIALILVAVFLLVIAQILAPRLPCLLSPASVCFCPADCTLPGGGALSDLSFRASMPSTSLFITTVSTICSSPGQSSSRRIIVTITQICACEVKAVNTGDQADARQRIDPGARLQQPGLSLRRHPSVCAAS